MPFLLTFFLKEAEMAHPIRITRCPRPLMAAMAAMVVLCLVVANATAQTFPSKPLRIVVPNAAGGAADLTARTVGQTLGEALGQPVVVEN